VPQKPGIGVYIVDGAAVDADRSEEAGVSSRAGQIGADVAVFEKYGITGVTAFDVAIEIVPLIDPTNGSIRLLELVEMRKRFAARDFVEKSENGVKDAAADSGGDQE